MSTLGILGGGQLGRMIAQAALPLGVRCRFLDPTPDAPAGVLGHHVRGEYEDYAALYEFMAGCDAVTYEFENVPVESARWLAERLPVFPPPAALEVAQDRLREKQFFRVIGAAVPEYYAAESREEFDSALAELGPAVVKTTRFGYDGKGQATIRTPADAESAWQRLGGRTLIAEKLVPFEAEVSLVAVRSRRGDLAYYPLTWNVHREGMLRYSFAPAPEPFIGLQAEAERVAAAAMSALDYVGVLAIEFFVVDGKLSVNEMAPRVHNSGHWTTDAAVTSQFENHARAVLGLPLGSTRCTHPALMVNLIGSWPPVEQILGDPEAKLHLYGKAARPNRKVGHVTYRVADFEEARGRIGT